MKRIISLIAFSLSLITYHLSAQSVSEVMRDKDAYIYEIGYGETVAEADKNALSQLVSRSARIVHSVSSVQGEKATEKDRTYVDDFVESSSVVNTVYLDNIGRFILSDEKGMKRVMRYVLVTDWENRYDYCKTAIEQYLVSGIDAKSNFRPDDALKFFSWAYVLLQIYPFDDISIEGVTSGIPQFCYMQMKEILNDLSVSVIAVKKVSASSRVHYPYELLLDFTYRNEPVDYLTFSYFDGSMYVDGATVKDGRSSVDMVGLPETFDVSIEFLHTDLARQLDPNVYALLSSPTFSLSVEGSLITVETLPPGTPKKRKINTNASYVESLVKEKLDESAASHASFRQEHAPERNKTYEKVLGQVADAISSGRTADVKSHFTPEAWDEFTRIVGSGSPKLIRTPEFKTFRLDTLLMYRSIPVKLKFKGNRSFVEDVVFRVSSNTGKISGVSYALSAKTVDNILAMQWEDEARILLINFLEDYRTAYCLKDINFIERVFADDAYIIVGKMLRKSRNSHAREELAVQLGQDRAVYQTKSKREYISDLRQSFRSKEFVNIRFEECHPAKGYGSKEGIYAVQVKQHYYSDNYADEGYLTLAIDMREKDPLVKVRVWQEKKDTSYTAETMIERTVSTGSGIY